MRFFQLAETKLYFLELLFVELWKNSSCLLQFPNEFWTLNKICKDNIRYISFCKFYIRKYSISNVEREVLVDNKCNTEVTLYGTKILKNIPEKEKSFQYLQSLIELIDNFKVCPGGPTFDKYDPCVTYFESAKADHTNRTWRQLKCPLIQSSLQRCNFCNSLKTP